MSKVRNGKEKTAKKPMRWKPRRDEAGGPK